MDDRTLQGYLERGVSALERLATDPEIQVETKPPVCPHCERINPTVRTEESGGTGAMAEILYRFHCLHCNNLFYAIPVQWESVKNTEEARMLVEMRKDIGGYSE